MAALGVDYYDLGRETGKIVVRILNGEKAGAIPVYTPQSAESIRQPNTCQRTRHYFVTSGYR